MLLTAPFNYGAIPETQIPQEPLPPAVPGAGKCTHAALLLQMTVTDIHEQNPAFMLLCTSSLPMQSAYQGDQQQNVYGYIHPPGLTAVTLRTYTRT